MAGAIWVRRSVVCGLAVAVVLVVLQDAGFAQPAAQDAKPPEEVDWLALAMGAVAGLVLFLYGVAQLARELKAVAGERMRKLLERAAGHRIRGLLTGTAATVALDSSSVTIILVITLVDAGVLSFVSALSVILGSNIGTTFSSQIFAFNIDEYAPLLMAAAFATRSLVTSDRAKSWATCAFSIGLVLFGLHTIGSAAEPLEGNQTIIDWLKTLDNPLYGVLAGAAVTIAIQSSSAMLGIVITLAGQGLIDLPAGIAIMLGAEIGTCADTLLATVGRSRAAVRAGIFHLVFNMISVAIGVALIQPITGFAEASSGDTGRQIANAHVAFNVAGALLFIGFLGVIARLLCRMIPDRAETADTPAGGPAPVPAGTDR